MRPEAIELYNLLTAEWNKKPQNLEKCLDLLSRLKVMHPIEINLTNMLLIFMISDRLF